MYEVRLPSDVQTLLRNMRVVVTLGISLGLQMTPLACVGLDGFAAELRFWMVTPPVLVTIILVAVCLRRAGNTLAAGKMIKEMRDASWLAGEVRHDAAPYVLRLLLCARRNLNRPTLEVMSPDPTNARNRTDLQ